MNPWRAALVLLAALALGSDARADPRRDPTWVRSGAPGDPAELFPRSSPLYAPHKADPMEFRSSGRVIDSSLADSFNLATAVGVRPVMYEFTLNDGMRAQVLATAVGFGRFDLASSADFISGDWRYGFLLATRYERWSYGLFLSHFSSHLGDELLLETGRGRIEYVLEEAALFASFDHTRHARYYYGMGYCVRQKHDDRPARVQGGVEYFFEERRLTAGLGPYLALDVQARGETGWSPSAQLVLGFALPGSVPDRTLDLQLMISSGPSAMRQFFAEDESYAGFGFAVDM